MHCRARARKAPGEAGRGTRKVGAARRDARGPPRGCGPDGCGQGVVRGGWNGEGNLRAVVAGQWRERKEGEERKDLKGDLRAEWFKGGRARVGCDGLEGPRTTWAP